MKKEICKASGKEYKRDKEKEGEEVIQLEEKEKRKGEEEIKKKQVE